MPMASMSANTVVGPTKRNPRRWSSAVSATDSAELLGTSARLRGAGAGTVGDMRDNDRGADDRAAR